MTSNRLTTAPEAVVCAVVFLYWGGADTVLVMQPACVVEVIKVKTTAVGMFQAGLIAGVDIIDGWDTVAMS